MKGSSKPDPVLKREGGGVSPSDMVGWSRPGALQLNL